MPYQIIASDLDGTLLNGERRLGSYTRDVIRWLHQQGRTVLLASGRHCIDMEGIRQRLDLPLYLIGSNGGQVIAPDGTTLLTQTLTPDSVQQLVTLGRDTGVHLNLYFSDRWLVEQPFPRLLEAHKDSGFAYQVTDLGDGALEGVIKLYFIGEPARLAEIEQTIIRSSLADSVQLVYAEEHSLEVMARGVSKGAALAKVLALQGLDAAKMVAFGDGMNDREMLETAGCGLLMANAMDKLKTALPAHKVIGHHRDEAVAEHLADLFGYPRVA